MIRLKAHREPPAPPSQKKLEAQIFGGRSVLLVAVILTVLNLFLAGASQKLPFEVAVPYYLVLLGLGADNGATDAAIHLGPWTAGTIAIAVVILLAVLACWYFGKKHNGWMIAGLVIFCVDTVAMAALALTALGAYGFDVIDLCIHLWALFLLATAVRAGVKKKALYGTEE